MIACARDDLGDMVHSNLASLSARDESGALHVVVESPGGSRVKLKYEPGLGAFTVSRPLVLGVAYPFDWGFVPGTRGPDGDPIDAIVVSDFSTYPGVVIRVRPLGVIRVEQNAKNGGGRQRNDRIVAEALPAHRSAGVLPERVRKELEEFFVATALFEKKDIEILGWGSAEEAEALIDTARREA
jgi:inorganic pyrophosphatase